MTLIALASAKGSPGVTTLALALAHVWPRRVLLAECDPAGGDIAPGYLGGADPNRGLLDLTIAARRTDLGSALGSQLVALDDTGTRALLPGLRDPAQAAALAPWWDRLAALFGDLGHLDDGGDAATDVLADCGRLTTAHTPSTLLRRADLVVVVLRPTLRSVAHAESAVTALRTGDPVDDRRLVAVLVGAGRPYTTREVARALRMPVLAIAEDARSAAVFSDGAPAGRGVVTSALLRSARTLADRLTQPRTDPGSDSSVPSVPVVPSVASNGHRPVPASRGAGEVR